MSPSLMNRSLLYVTHQLLIAWFIIGTKAQEPTIDTSNTEAITKQYTISIDIKDCSEEETNGICLIDVDEVVNKTLDVLDYNYNVDLIDSSQDGDIVNIEISVITSFEDEFDLEYVSELLEHQLSTEFGTVSVSVKERNDSKESNDILHIILSIYDEYRLICIISASAIGVCLLCCVCICFYIKCRKPKQKHIPKSRMRGFGSDTRGVLKVVRSKSDQSGGETPMIAVNSGNTIPLSAPPQKEKNVTTVGDRVLLKKYLYTGVVRFIGPIQGKKGIFYGIELDKGWKGKNDGFINNKKYFNTTPNQGLFIRKSRIKERTVGDPNKRVSVGDEVNVPYYQCHGIIRFIGITSFKEGIWYGIELKRKNGDNNGSVDNEWYFECSDGYGIMSKSNAFEVYSTYQTQQNRISIIQFNDQEMDDDLSEERRDVEPEMGTIQEKGNAFIE